MKVESEMADARSKSVRAPWWQVILVGRRPWVTLVRLFIIVLLILLARAYVIIPARVMGISMLPTYPDGGIKFINRRAFVSKEPQRGDVVAVRFTGEHVMLLKRIVGLPGETVAFRDGRLLINGRYVPEPYVKLPTDWTLEPEVLGSNEFYVVGDNRSMNPADHMKGIATRDRIIGKPL